MHIGVTIFPTDYSMHPQDLAKEAEARGFESFWVPEHSHIPTSRRSPFPGGGELPKWYHDTYDPFLALTAAAAVTKTIKLATGICLVIERHPIHTAKEVATLDRLSGGRFVFGVGGGWNAEEMENHGTAFPTRFKVMRESIAAMKEIWSKSKAQFNGEFVKFEELMQWPKPVQKPHPPIIVGGAFPHAAKRAIAYGDGWMPVVRGTFDPAHTMQKFHALAKEAGRDPATLTFEVFGGPHDADLMKRCRDAGVSRYVLMYPSKGRDEVLPVLDKDTAMMRAL
jgi:probable F420-dependent oxidoreductase